MASELHWRVSMKIHIALAASIILLLAGCDAGSSKSSASSEPAAPGAPAQPPAPARPSAPVKRLAFPNGEAGAKALVAGFLQPGADLPALSASLRPDPADYAAVFVGDAAAKVERAHAALWNGGDAVFRPKPDQTEGRVASQPVDKMRGGDTGPCPGGYKDAAAQMKPGLNVYCFKFVKPGETLGMAFDGLIFVNGHWAIFPKPWKALR